MNILRNLIAASAIALAFTFAVPAFATGPVDINSADARTLAEGMSGIGLRKAEAIVEYRTQHGPFRNADDLAKVKGIGPKTVDKNRDAIVIGEASGQREAPPGKAAAPSAA